MANALRERDVALVTLDDVGMLLPGRAPRSTVRALREAGWLFGMRTRGVWGFSAASFATPCVGGYWELHARFLMRPDTPGVYRG